VTKELLPHEFTERLLPIFEHIERETGISGRNNPKHFFPAWQRMMSIGVARTWENDGCVLGAIFTPELYSGKIQVHVIFWFSLPEARGTGRPHELLDACELAAKNAGAFKISSSAHIKSAPARAAGAYLKRGYEETETLFTKNLSQGG
jgi:GNAT superfamily N-acetyltransferase